MTKPVFKKIEFYITNVCNLTCDHCNRFNNFDFRGWQKWSDYEDDYQRWGKLIDLQACTIMGGEPLLNPSIVDWVHGINQAFGIGVQILTNGTRLNKVPGLYDALAGFKRIDENGTHHVNSVAVSLHNLDELEGIKSAIHEFLPGTVYQDRWRPDLWGANYQFGNNKNVFINVYYQDEFDTSSIWVDSQGRRNLHNHNDPNQAHDACTFAGYKSYHFIRGKLYKCGPAALMPEFDQQHPFDLSDEDREILYGYKPLTVDNFAEYSQEFLTNLDKPIAQCKFCPTEKSRYKIFPVRKGNVKL